MRSTGVRWYTCSNELSFDFVKDNQSPPRSFRDWIGLMPNRSDTLKTVNQLKNGQATLYTPNKVDAETSHSPINQRQVARASVVVNLISTVPEGQTTALKRIDTFRG